MHYLTNVTRSPPAASSATPGLDDLRRLARQLDGLLGDPNPGLHTWRRSLSNTLLEMADYAGYGPISEAVRRANGA